MASRQPTCSLDDSGHPAPNYATGAVVIGGFSVASGDGTAINRRLADAKAGSFPNVASRRADGTFARHPSPAPAELSRRRE